MVCIPDPRGKRHVKITGGEARRQLQKWLHIENIAMFLFVMYGIVSQTSIYFLCPITVFEYPYRPSPRFNGGSMRLPFIFVGLCHIHVCIFLVRLYRAEADF